MSPEIAYLYNFLLSFTCSFSDRRWTVHQSQDHFSPLPVKCKDKGKGHPITDHKGPDVEKRYSSTLSLTSALEGVGGQRHAPAALPPGKTRYSLYRRLGEPPGRSGQVRKISPPTGVRSPDHPARSESLYRLNYPCPFLSSVLFIN